MVQTYGVARAHGAEDPMDAGGERDESSALLGGTGGRPASLGKGDDGGRATLVSCISNLLNTIIGSGMLTFPLAMASAGLLPGMLTCVLSGGVAAFGLYLLSLCAAYTHGRHASFHAVSQLTFPRAAVFFDGAIAVKCFGVSISYLIIIKGLMPNVVASLYHDLTSETTNPPAWALDGRNWISFFMLILVPLCFLRHLNSLRHTSYIALFSVAYLVVIVIWCYHWPLEGMTKPGEVRLIHFTPDFVSTFPVQVFAFTCAQNLFPIYNELKRNSQKRMNIVIVGSIGTAAMTYEVIAIFGYLTFGSKVGPNIIAMYPSTSLFVAVGQLAIVVLVLFSYPLQVHPCRNCLDKVFHPGHVAVPPSKSKVVDEVARVGAVEEEEDDTSSRSSRSGSEETEEIVPEPEGDEHGHHGEMSAVKHFLLTAGIIVAGFTVAYLVDDLQMVLSFVGATGSTTISFILPGLFYWKLTRDDFTRKSLNLSAFFLMIYGICVCVFCLSFNIYQIIQYKGTAHLEEAL